MRSRTRLRVGDAAPEFSLADEHGAPRALRGLRASGPVVLFFYPAASSFGCTRECRHVRDLVGEFAVLGAQPVGVSPDEVESQLRFAEAESLGFPLLSDSDGAVAGAYGVRRARGPIPLRRTTFVIDEAGIVRAVIASETRFSAHADRAVAALRSLAAKQRGRAPGG